MTGLNKIPAAAVYLLRECDFLALTAIKTESRNRGDTECCLIPALSITE